MGYLGIIRDSPETGCAILNKFRAFEKNDHGLMKTELDLEFFSSCKFHAVIPNFLNFKLVKSRLPSLLMHDSCRGRFLSVKIASKNKHLQNQKEKHVFISHHPSLQFYT